MYLDAAYIAKCYVNEVDAPAVRSLVRGRTDLTSSAICLAELGCLFHRHVRAGALTVPDARRLRATFAADVRSGAWTLLPVSLPVLEEVERRLARLEKTIFVRAGDALHLVTAAEAGFTEVWTNDRHMLAAATHFGLSGKSV